MNSALTLESSNGKTGPIAVSTTSRTSCAPGCPLSGVNGCYAEAGYYTRMHWDAVTAGTRGQGPVDFINRVATLPVGSLFRHNVAGDLWPGVRPNLIDGVRLTMLAEASRHLTAWTYTHHERNLENLAAIRAALRRGFTVNLSTESKRDAATFYKRGYPVTCVVPADSPRSFRYKETLFRQCPATVEGSTVTCATCGGAKGKPLCSLANRNFVITFPVHGSRSKAAALQCS
jgi:hypothetical protein